MPGIVRKNQDTTGGLNIQGSSNVFVNGKGAVRINDLVLGHGPGTHGAPYMAQGSPNVFVNGKKVCRKGDIANCGHPASSASNNVFAN